MQIDMQMPALISRGQKQHSTIESNATRGVTSIRWVVEADNGRIKRFKYFDNHINNKVLKTIHTDVQIVCAIINCFRGSAIANTSRDEQIAAAMLHLMNTENALKVILNTKPKFTKTTADRLDDFPQLTSEDLTLITLGVYQVNNILHIEFLRINTFYLCLDKNGTVLRRATRNRRQQIRHLAVQF